MTGCQHHKKKFTVPAAKVSDKKCFYGDCVNEGESCKECRMIQGKYIFYHQTLTKGQEDASKI